MTHWNYRVVEIEEEIHGIQDNYCQIMEIYYENGAIRAYIDKPAIVLGNDKEDLERTMELMKKAFDLPTLKYKDLPQ